MTPTQLLDEAERLFASEIPGTRGLWPRASAWLIRLALEQALDDYWVRTLPEAAWCGMRPQLLLLPAYAGEDIAQLAADAWLGLARATHHHAYELGCTAAELRSWHRAVTQISAALSAA